MLGLLVWTQSGGAPYTPEAPRFPVTVGTPADAARYLGFSAPTVRRHWQSFESAFAALDGGRYTPALSTWRDPSSGPVDAKGRPLYVKITPKAVRALTTLGRCAPAKLAWSAFKIAIAILPRLRAAQHQGRRFIVWTNDQIAASLQMGRTAITRAWRLLETRGVVATVGGRYRKISTANGLLAGIPKPGDRARLGFPQPVDDVVENFGRSDQNGTARTIKTGPILKDKQDPNSEHTPREARGVECPDRQIWAIFGQRFPGMQRKAIAYLASFCDSPESAADWIAAEGPALEEADNPPGLMLYLARSNQSRPGRLSNWSRKIEDKAARRRIALMQWFPSSAEPLSPETAQRLKEEEARADVVRELRTAQAATEKERRIRLGLTPSKPKTYLDDVKRYREEATDKDEGKARIAALLATLNPKA
jgi:hypothetical protein